MTDYSFPNEPATEPRPKPAAMPATTAPECEPIAGINWAALEGRTPPAREFIVEGWLATGVATSLYAPGGTGKSMLAQQLGAAVSAGKPFLGLPTMKAPVLALFCEDDDDELFRRQHRINGIAGIRMAELGAFAAQGRLGMSNLLMTFPKGRAPDSLPLLGEIENRAREIGAKLIILDNAAQLFGGEENARAEVTSFLNALNGLARRVGAAVLLLGHPPKNGADYSGSTAWHSVVRCMWKLDPVTPEAGDDEADAAGPGALVLRRCKANYAPTDEEIRLRWVEGVLRRDDGEMPASPMDAAFHRHNAKQAFLKALDELTAQRRSVSDSERAGNYAPKAIKAAGLAEGFSKADLKRAMNELFRDRAIIARAPLWKGSDRKPVLGIARDGAGRSPEHPADLPAASDPGDVRDGAGWRTDLPAASFACDPRDGAEPWPEHPAVPSAAGAGWRSGNLDLGARGAAL